MKADQHPGLRWCEPLCLGVLFRRRKDLREQVFCGLLGAGVVAFHRAGSGEKVDIVNVIHVVVHVRDLLDVLRLEVGLVGCDGALVGELGALEVAGALVSVCRHVDEMPGCGGGVLEESC